MKTFLCIAALALLTVGCKKEVDSLPEVTQTGANTFGAKVDGEKWGPLTFGAVPGAPILEARASADSSVFITARNLGRSPVETEMEIYLKNAKTTGTYNLNQLTEVYPAHSASYGYFLKRNLTVVDQWITGPSATGQVEVTKMDWTERIVSGTFSFTAAAKYGSPAVVVTEGRFDVKF